MNILLIQILRLGDALQLTPVAEAIRTLHPEARISVVTSLLGKIIFERQEFIDDVYVIHKEELAGLVKKSDIQSINTSLDLLNSDLEPVISKKWDWVINLSFSFPSALLAFLAHGTKNSGFFATKNREYLSKEKWFSYSLASFPNRKYSLFNWVDINSNIAGTHGISNSPVFPIREDESLWAYDQVRRFSPDHEDLIGIHPGASGDYKIWPLENFIKLSQNLIDKHRKKIIIFGDKNEQKLGRRIEAALGRNVLDLTGRTSLGQTAAVMSHCSLILCNDSGPMHLASAVGTPVLALFFSTHFVETGPYGVNHLVMHPMLDCFPCQGTASCTDKKCLKMIPVDAVEELIINRNDIMIHPTEAPENYPPMVAANRSRLDPWGYLEWAPALKRPATITTLVKLILKLSFIPCLTNQEIDEQAANDYARDFLGFFSHPVDIEELQDQLLNLLTPINDLGALLNESLALCSELYNQSSDMNRNAESIRRLGVRLQGIEDSLLSMRSPYMDIVKKFIEMERNNLDERDFHRLASQNVRLYKESIMLIERLRQNTQLASGLLNTMAAPFPRQSQIDLHTSRVQCDNLH
jgi:lipopolysaccharide heptosyltransferase II